MWLYLAGAVLATCVAAVVWLACGLEVVDRARDVLDPRDDVEVS